MDKSYLELTNTIILIKHELDETIKKNDYDLIHPRVIEISQLLDELINAYFYH
jgi:hypothetical protein